MRLLKNSKLVGEPFYPTLFLKSLGSGPSKKAFIRYFKVATATEVIV